MRSTVFWDVTFKLVVVYRHFREMYSNFRIEEYVNESHTERLPFLAYSSAMEIQQDLTA
jgi:hypothetical protein